MQTSVPAGSLMRRYKPGALTLGFSLLVGIAGASADTLVLVNGDHMTGKLKENTGPRLEFETEYAGTVKIPWEYVQSLQLDEPAYLELDTGDVLNVTSVELLGGVIRYQPAYGDDVQSVAANEIRGLNPEAWMNNVQGDWTGEFNLSIRSETGNGDEDFVDLDFDVTYRRKDDRFRAAGEWDYDQKTTVNEIDVPQKDEWIASGNYDYFFDKKRYFSWLLALEGDTLEELSLRTRTGPFFGYQFFESKPLNLLGEIGILSLREDYKTGEDTSALYPSWHIKFDKLVYSDFLQFYHENFGSIEATGENRFLFRTWTGFRITAKSGFRFTVEHKIDYDSDPVEVPDTTETTLRFKLGYSW